ncbi:MAG: c-type cytochrome biogenesis protein CcsB [Cryobacterium sp.]|nr:c-type cytochrome biogenesis protein CcsB [Cryobacterium sp.]
MAVYSIALVFFAIDIAKRSSLKASPVQSELLGQADGFRGSIAVAKRAAPVAQAKASRFERTGFALTILAWLLHLAGAVLRGLANGYVPWSNMFEFSLVVSLALTTVFLGIQFWQKLGYLGVYATGASLIVLGVGTVNFYVDVTPLAVPLQSVWIIIHVGVAILATAFFAIGAGLSILQLLKARYEANPDASRLGFLRTIPSSVSLESLAYRMVVVGFVLWTFTLIAGAIWAERAWGRFWGWDTKEVWTFIIWVIYAGYIHARATRGWRGAPSAWLSIVGIAAVVFNYTIVNLFFKGLHAYSGL